MTNIQERILRALIAAQVAVLEWGDEDEEFSTIPKASSDLQKCLKEATKLAKRLEDS